MYLLVINCKIHNRGHCNKKTTLDWASVCFIVNESYLFSFDYVIVVWQCGPYDQSWLACTGSYVIFELKNRSCVFEKQMCHRCTN